jgi:hypothetical protein
MIERASWNANFDGGPRRDGMAEAFVRTIKSDYVHVSPCPNAQTVMHQLSAWINHYNEVHPHKALGYRSPRESPPTRIDDVFDAHRGAPQSAMERKAMALAGKQLPISC